MKLKDRIMSAKYIIFDDGEKEFGMIFPESFCHECIARLINKPVISAGFVKVEESHTIVYGFSLSLGVNFRIQDADILANLLDEQHYCPIQRQRPILHIN